MTFRDKLEQTTQRNNSLLCVGLDPDPGRLPQAVQGEDDPVLAFNRRIIDATADLVCAYKPNFAFYGALGSTGFDTLKRTIEHVPEGIPVLIDAKVGDIDSTAARYAHMFFAELGGDALTVNPYMGGDAVAPFLAYPDKGIFLVCLTSNPGADDFEKQPLADGPLYEYVARKGMTWDKGGQIGLVVGATQPELIGGMRKLAPDVPFLVPGVGAQGGDLEAAVRYGQDGRGQGMLINASRGVTYAGSGDDFDKAARAAAVELRDGINQYRVVRA
ncbi:MAG: orotidine-5'-phosphate decarboxylase [Candidatus Latescibacteria bacterium]|nr:orotidine-5'-phosphate decarboxylase [Candidatus Latescibacterota bacterium]